MGVTPGWADHEEFVLLELFRANLWDYIYRSTDEFAEIVHVALPGEASRRIRSWKIGGSCNRFKLRRCVAVSQPVRVSRRSDVVMSGDVLLQDDARTRLWRRCAR